MEAKELRIGNYITDQFGEVCTVDSINPQEIFNAEIGEIALYCISPIPLTEEWLLNFGFEVYRFGFKENQYRLKDRLIVIRNGLFCDYGTSVIIKHVHQLQNLYFALTGEELTLSK